MLFDLKSGRRRRVVQVVFGALAFLFFISFVGFGIGSDVSGGIFDALGLSDGSGAAQYEDQIEDAEKALDEDPNDEQAMLELVRYNFLAATEEGISTDPQTQVTEISEESRGFLEAAVAAWDDYLATNPRRPDPGVAANAAQAFVYLEDYSGAAQAQRIVAESQGSAVAWNQLALYLYSEGKLKAGDDAGRQAVKAAEPSQRDAVRRNVEQLAKRARQYKKQLEKAARQQGQQGGSSALDNPFGSLVPGGTGAPTP